MSEPLPVARVIDARELAPPEPFVVTMEALDELAPGERLVLLLYRDPLPLYRVLVQNGFRHRAEVGTDGTYEISIWRE